VKIFRETGDNFTWISMILNNKHIEEELGRHIIAADIASQFFP